MANNTQLNAGSGGDIMLAEDIGSYKIPGVKIYIGPAGVSDGPVTAANRLPVTMNDQFAEDAAHVSGDKGTMALGVRMDTAAALAGATGDYQPPIFDSTGRLWVNNSAPIAAGTNVIGAAVSPGQTGTLYSGTTALTPKFAKIDAASSGSNQLVAAVSGKKIRVLRFALVAAADVTAKFQSASTDLTGAMSLGAKGGIGGAEAILGHFETASNEALNLNLGGAVQVSGSLTYVEV